MYRGKLSKDQKEKVKQFAGVTSCPDKLSTEYLKNADWSLEGALEAYFNQAGTSAPPDVNKDGLNALYNKYKTSDSDKIEGEGIEKFCEDLGLDPVDVVVYIIAWKLKAAECGAFTKEEFVTGFAALGCDSFDKIKKKIPELRAVMNDDNQFKDAYNFAFDYYNDPGVKSMAQDIAIDVWGLLIAEKFKHLDLWKTFLTECHNKAISKDTWSLLLEFAKQMGNKPDFSSYDPMEAWPVIIDEFVEWTEENNKFEKS